MFEEYRSKCCKAEIEASGVPDFIGDTEICTWSCVCSKCGNPCNIEEINDTRLSCYLAGSFTPFNAYPDWRDYVIKRIGDAVKFYDPRTDTHQGSITTFVSEDLAGVESCDCIFYFMMESQCIGAAIECAVSNAKGKLVILCIDRSLDFVDPFLIGISRRICIGIDSGVVYLLSLARHGIADEFKVLREMMERKTK